MTATGLPMDVTGWFQVGWSRDFEPGTVAPLRFFGRDMVAYRSADGVLTVLDAHCPHLGAHLGYGGSVEDGCVVCPFHGWKWNADGENVEIPYQDRPNRAKRIGTWSVVERNEGVFVWNDSAGRPPLWDLPDMFRDLLETDDEHTVEDFYPANPDGIVRYDDLSMHPQVLVENAVDLAHFTFVHGTNPPPTSVSQDVDGSTFKATVDFIFGGGRKSTWLTPDGPVSVRLHNLFSGVGLSFACFDGGDRYRTLLSATPVDDEHATLFHSIWVPRIPGDTGDRLPERQVRRMRDAKWQLKRDIEIWVHQQHLDPGALAATEVQGFNLVRRWARRFYPGTEESTLLGVDGSLAGQEVGIG